MTKPSIQPGLYKHTVTQTYYAVLGVSRDSTNGPTDGRVDVLYVSLDPLPDDEWGGHHHREISQFLEQVHVAEAIDPCSNMVPRFKYLGKAPNAAELTVSLTESELVRILQENVHLRAQVTELHKDNTAHKLEWQEARQQLRKAEGKLRAAEKQVDELKELINAVHEEDKQLETSSTQEQSVWAQQDEKYE